MPPAASGPAGSSGGSWGQRPNQGQRDLLGPGGRNPAGASTMTDNDSGIEREGGATSRTSQLSSSSLSGMQSQPQNQTQTRETVQTNVKIWSSLKRTVKR